MATVADYTHWLRELSRILGTHDPILVAIQLHGLRELGWTLDGIERWMAANRPTPTPTPPPVPGLVPIRLSGLVGNFLYPFQSFFFGPACAAFDASRRAQYFAHCRTRGDSAVVINAHQDDWGPGRGHPEWTSGGTDAYRDSAALTHLVNVLILARQAGLVPVLGLIDQSRLSAWTLDQIIARTRDVVNATHPHVACYMLSWEIEEVWTDSQARVDALHRWHGDIDWHGRLIGIHYADGLRDSTALYGPLGADGVRLMQWDMHDDEAAIRDKARKIAVTARLTGSRVCAFEHSSPNLGTAYTEIQAVQRAGWAMHELQALLPPGQLLGSLNG